MATAASLKFSIESKWDGSGVRKAKEDLADLQKQLRDIGNKVTARVKVEPSMVGFMSKVREGVRGESVAVRVDPNLTGLQRRLDEAARTRDYKLKAKIDLDSAAAQAQLDAFARDKTLKVKVEVDRNSFGALNTALGGVGGAANVATGSMRAFGTAAGQAASKVGLLGRVVPIVAGVLAGGLAASGYTAQDALDDLTEAAKFLGSALLGVVAGATALGTTVVAAASVVKIGMEGIKKAAENAKPAYDRLQQAIEGVFAEKMAAGFTKLNGLLDNIRPEVMGIADALSGMFNGLVDTLTQNEPKIKSILNDVSAMITEMTPGMQKLVQGIIDFVEKVDFKQIGKDIGDLIGKAGEWLSSLSAEDIKQGWEDFKSLLSGTVGAVQSVVSALQSVKSALDGIKQVTDMLPANVFARMIGDGVGEILSAIGEVRNGTMTLEQAFRTLATSALSAVGGMAEKLGGILKYVPGFSTLGTVLESAGIAAQQMAEKFRSIPDNKNVKVTADTSAALFSMQDVYTFMQQLDAAQVTPEVRAQVQQALADFKLTQDELNTIAGMNPSPEVTAIIAKAIDDLATVNGELKATGENHQSPNVGIIDNASGPIGDIQRGIDGLHDKTITITTRHVYETLGQSGAAYNTSDMGASTAYRWRGGIAGRWKGGIAPKLPGHAGGYKLPTSGPGTHMRDGFLGITSRGMPIARVDAGEWIVNRWSSKTFHSAIDALNRKDPMAAIAALQRHVRPGGGDRRASSPTGAAPQLNGGSLDVNIHLTVDGNASRETLDAAAAAFSPKFEMALKQGVGVRTKVAK